MNAHDTHVEQVTLVNERDEVIGRMEKLEAHRVGALHRAFSIFIFNREGRLLLQQRADGKYHSPGLWTNSCCGHPRPGEPTMKAAQRRLHEELGIRCELTEEFTFSYRAEFGNGLIEHELDHVFFG
ncbi:MAG TPA: isopentenyl-diphosphate Delta-isomerase, partial [Flavobacteriales bacterium]|nr:isopentenyl-diphosphate Delta-isomerase [Flavobacteriales bacterium]